MHLLVRPPEQVSPAHALRGVAAGRATIERAWNFRLRQVASRADTRPMIRAAIALSAVLLLPTPALAQEAAAPSPLSAEEQRIAAYADAQVEDAIRVLERVVNVNSGTMNLAGVRKVGQLFAAEFRAVGFATRWESMPKKMKRAGHLVAERKGSKGKRLLLIGHLDTVFERSSPFQKWKRESPERATGPGVADMKGGDVVILYALKALQSVGALEDRSITVIFTGDEENSGDPTEISRRSLIEAAKQSDAALELETLQVDDDGTTYGVTARRGTTVWNLMVTGPGGHSSGIFSDSSGPGAAYETARILEGFRSTVAPQPNVTLSPGLIVCGTDAEVEIGRARGSAFGKSNVIARQCVTRGDLRTLTAAGEATARETMTKIVSTNLPKTRAEIAFESGYPPMAPTEGNRALLREFDKVSQDLGLGPIEEMDPNRRGAADSSFAAPHTDVLGGIGVGGDRAHAEGESIDLTTLAPQIKRTALLIYRLTR